MVALLIRARHTCAHIIIIYIYKNYNAELWYTISILLQHSRLISFIHSTILYSMNLLDIIIIVIITIILLIKF